MNVIVEKLPQCRVSMRVELSPEEVKSERNHVVEAFRRQARIPGYRPGKVPLPVIEKRFQKEISEELESRLVKRGCQEGIKKESLEVVAVTGIDEQVTHADQSFSFTAKLQIAPDFALPSYVGIPVAVAPAQVSDDQVDRQMDLLRHRHSQFVDLDRPLEMGDLAVIQFAATLEGKPLEEAVEGSGFLARSESEWVRLASDSFIPGFCEALVGASAGETRDFEVTVPEDFQVEPVRGKTLAYQVTVKEGKQQVLPEWTDELAREFGAESLEDLRLLCRTRLEEVAQETRINEMNTQILEFLDKNLEFELPPQVLAQETQRQVNQIVTRIHQRGMSEDQITEQKDAIIQHASNQAEVNVKTAFIVRQIAEKEKIRATEQELATYCVHLAQSAGITLKKYLRQLQKSDALEDVMDRISHIKTLKFLRDHANVTDAPLATPGEPAAAE